IGQLFRRVFGTISDQITAQPHVQWKIARIPPRKSGSVAIYAALTIALNAGKRDAEIRSPTWAQADVEKQFLTVGKSKTGAGEGRTIPLNSRSLRLWSRLSEFVNHRAKWPTRSGTSSTPQIARPRSEARCAGPDIRANAA